MQYSRIFSQLNGHSRLHRVLRGCALALAIGVPAAAQAQTAQMGLPTIAKDRGLRSGDFVLHPSISVQGRHDTNLFNGNELESGNSPVGATSIRIIPRLSLANDLTSNTTFVFASAGDARIYVSDNKSVTAQDNIGGNANLDLTFGQRKALAFSVFDHFIRALRANNWETRTTLNRNSNDVGGRIEFHPGDIPERRPFNIALIGAYSVDRFEDFKAGDTNTVRSRLTGSWRFLPKTAAVIDASWDFRNYANNSLANSGLSFGSQPFRALVGVAGALTKRVSFQVQGGWGLSMHTSGASYNNYLATASVGVRPSESTRLTLGYTHDFRDVFYGNFTEFHRGWLYLHQRFGSIMDVRAQFGASYGTYGAYTPTIAVKITQKNRRDVALDGGLTASFEVARLVSMDIGYQLRSVITDYQISSVGLAAGDRILDVGAYTAHEIFASLTLRY